MINQNVKVGVNGKSDVVGRYLHLTDLILEKKFESPELKEIIEFNKKFSIKKNNNTLLASRSLEAPVKENSWLETGLEILLGVALAPLSMMGCSSDGDDYHHCITIQCSTEQCYYNHQAEEQCECEEDYHLDCDSVGCECDADPEPQPIEKEPYCPSCD